MPAALIHAHYILLVASLQEREHKHIQRHEKLAQLPCSWR